MNLSLSKDDDQAPYIDGSVRMSLLSLHAAFCDHFIKEKASIWLKLPNGFLMWIELWGKMGLWSDLPKGSSLGIFEYSDLQWNASDCH